MSNSRKETGFFDPSWRHGSRQAVRYIVAGGSVGVMLLVTGWLREFFAATPNALFFCAIILGAWFGGFGPGIFASVLSILAIKYYFTAPGYSLAFTYADATHFLIFLISGTFISWLGHRQRQDEQALMKARAELEEKVRERTREFQAANERLTVEVAERTRAELDLQRRNRAWRVRSACNQAVSRSTDEMKLMEEVCRTVVVEGGYRLAWAGYPVHDAEKSIRPVARAGEGQGYLDNIVASWGEGELGNGPAGTAIRTGVPVVCNKMSSDPRFTPWRAKAESHGLRSSVALPLQIDGETIGGLLVYSDEADAFDEAETELLLLTAADLSQGVALLRSRTDRQAAREALKQKEEELERVARVTAMGELTASIAHEVNQPLGAVVTNANAGLRWLSAEPPNGLEVREALQRIARDGSRAAEVIARIRGLLKKSDAVTESLDFNALIREIEALTEGEAKRRGAVVKTELGENLPRVQGDRVQLQQVLLNLAINAMDAMSGLTDRARVVNIRTSAPDGKGIQVAVEDSGTGLNAEEADHLFDAFYTTKPGGLGMGLSISRSIVEAHGGRLWATDNAGPGATFQFTLPTEHAA